jgi:hypothetical protein
MNGLNIPSSFRESCDCCGGNGWHLSPCDHRGHICTACEGQQYVLNKLGRDVLKLLDSSEAVQE